MQSSVSRLEQQHRPPSKKDFNFVLKNPTCKDISNYISLDASSGLCVIEPVDAEVNYSSVSGKQDIHVLLSNVFTNLSFSVLQLILRLQEDISSFLRITSRQATIQCYEFDKIWTEECM